MIHRFIKKDIKYITGFHTQEYRHSATLVNPIKSKPEEAWLGVGYYFWLEEEFADYWGHDKKKHKTGCFDVYSANIEESKILNASFNENAYFKFRESIEITLNFFKEKGKKISLLQVNRFLADNIWPKLGINGIIFDDLPHNKSEKDRIYSEIEPFYYKKRIQLVAFELKIIHNFAVVKEEVC